MADELVHQRPLYDPAKAHEYYLRTRKLHPRARGSGDYTVKLTNGKTIKISAQKLAEQKAYAEHRVEELKKRLSDLEIILRAKLAKAQAAHQKANQPKTPAQKAQAALLAQKYRNSHKATLANKAHQAAKKAPHKKAAKVDTVASLKNDINKTKANLKAAVAKQRELATATKNG